MIVYMCRLIVCLIVLMITGCGKSPSVSGKTLTKTVELMSTLTCMSKIQDPNNSQSIPTFWYRLSTYSDGSYTTNCTQDNLTSSFQNVTCSTSTPGVMTYESYEYVGYTVTTTGGDDWYKRWVTHSLSYTASTPGCTEVFNE